METNSNMDIVDSFCKKYNYKIKRNDYLIYIIDASKYFKINDSFFLKMSNHTSRDLCKLNRDQLINKILCKSYKKYNFVYDFIYFN
jgi:hypothetical protein